ncbi:hypothetical protein F4861DRAFT_497461 [Xylaria intraflava]|nr:hypothetical protein F4861DRAFT_497461 [Xylaria intraflava]
MKLAIAILAIASTIVAQDLSGLPDCAKNCLAEFTTGNQIGNCARLDAKCICASSSFISGIACCLAGVCDTSDQQQAINFAHNFCSTQGVTNLPQSVTCTSMPASNSTATSATSAPTSTATPTATVTPNAGCALGSSANVYGGLLAALAML